MQILVFVDQYNSRIEYVLNHVLRGMLGFEVLHTQSEGDFKSFKGTKISYSQSKFTDCINIKPQGLLYQSQIIKQSFEISQWNSLPIFFKTDNENDIPFDIFSAIFYLISRYEEYLPHQSDAHGRFVATESIAYKNNFLQIPIVDLWVKELSILIKKYNSSAIIKPQTYHYIPTIDIDNAYAFKHKRLMYNTIGAGFSFLKLDLKLTVKRISVVLGLSKDPYDTYDVLFTALKNHPNSLWFILGGERGKYDRNLPLNSQPLRRLIDSIAKQFEVCIHPSYGSDVDISKVRREAQLLKSILRKPITKSRQHYLRINLPLTYRLLNQLDIQYDYSMGYSTHIGFRAGTCTPYHFYDLIDEKELSLVIVPFQVMDRALLQGAESKPDKAVELASEIAEKVKAVGGTFVTVWHNESLSGINEWKGWETVFCDIVTRVANP
jgi:hypothetical protein